MADPAGRRLFGMPVSRCDGPPEEICASSGGGEPDEGVDGEGETGSCGEYIVVREKD